jgi:hypothetical protein
MMLQVHFLRLVEDEHQVAGSSSTRIGVLNCEIKADHKWITSGMIIYIQTQSLQVVLLYEAHASLQSYQLLDGCTGTLDNSYEVRMHTIT